MSLLWLLTLYPVIGITIYLTSVYWYDSVDKVFDYELAPPEALAGLWPVMILTYGVVILPFIRLGKLRESLRDNIVAKRQEAEKKLRIATDRLAEDPLLIEAEQEVETLCQQDTRTHSRV